jgi:hypothetical protein
MKPKYRTSEMKTTFTLLIQTPQNLSNQIKKTVKKHRIFIPQNFKWKYINLNPFAPTLKGLIKIHKTNQPICSIELAKHSSL